MKGTIVAYSPSKHWGFIVDENGGKHFFHRDYSSGIKVELGWVVEFELIPPFRLGQPPQAANLRHLPGESVPTEGLKDSQVKGA